MTNLKVIEFQLLYDNQNEEKIKILSKDKDTALDFVHRNMKPGVTIDKIYSQAIVTHVDYIDDNFVVME